MKAEVKLITPEYAVQVLTNHNNGNRKVRAMTVQQYADDMKSGRWQANGEPIQFAKNGELKNGQHRLLAVAKSGVSVEMLVVSEVEDDVAVYDLGAKRNYSDIATFAGENTSLWNNNIIACVRFIIGQMKGTNQISYGEVEAFMHKYETQLLDVNAILNTNKQNRKSPILGAIFCAVYAGYPMEEIRSFCKILANGMYATISESAPAVLRNMLIAKRFDGSTRGKRLMFNVTQQALIDFHDGKGRTKSYGEVKGRLFENFRKDNKDE